MGGFFGSISKSDCVSDVFYGTDYHSHLGTKRAGMAFYSKGWVLPGNPQPGRWLFPE
jgi:hypothetical protein